MEKGGWEESRLGCPKGHYSYGDPAVYPNKHSLDCCKFWLNFQSDKNVGIDIWGGSAFHLLVGRSIVFSGLHSVTPGMFPAIAYFV